MFSSFSLPFSMFSGSSRPKSSLSLAPVKTFITEDATDKETKRLQALVKLNHANHSVFYNNLRFHNHAAHILGSSYILGATPQQLTDVYEAESPELESWKESPGEISKSDWRDFLGKKEYQRAYVDFFEDQLVSFGYDWKAMVEHFLYSGEEPLFNSLVCGLAHPLIHLAYAYELSNRIIGIEALVMACCAYEPLHKYIDSPKYTFPASYTTSDPLEILQRMTSDPRIGKEVPNGDSSSAEELPNEEVILDHWNAWDVDSPNLQERLQAAQRAAVGLVLGTRPVGARQYDFFLLHTLTSSHAARIMLPFVPAEFQLKLIRAWFLFVVVAYRDQQRPVIDLDRIGNYNPAEGKDSWKYVKHAALTSPHSTDAHFVKGLRSMLVADETWGEDDGFWKKAACRFAAEFSGWGGWDARGMVIAGGN